MRITASSSHSCRAHRGRPHATPLVAVIGLATACETSPPGSTLCAGNDDCPAGQHCDFDAAQQANVCQDDVATTTLTTDTATGSSLATTGDATSAGTSSGETSITLDGVDSSGSSGTVDPPPCILVDGECLGITRLDFQTVCTGANVQYSFPQPPGPETLIVPSVTGYGPGDVLIEPDGSRDQVFHIETTTDEVNDQIDVTIGCALAGDVPDNALKGYINAIGLPTGTLVGRSVHTFTYGTTCEMMPAPFIQPLPDFDDAAYASVTRFVALTAVELPTWNDTGLHNRDTTFETTLTEGSPWELAGRLNAGAANDQFSVTAYQVGLPAGPAVGFQTQPFQAFSAQGPVFVDFTGLQGQWAAAFVLVEDFDTEPRGQECNTNTDNDLAFVIEVSPPPPTDGPMTADAINVQIEANSDETTSEVRGQVVLVTMTPDEP